MREIQDQCFCNHRQMLTLSSPADEGERATEAGAGGTTHGESRELVMDQ